MTANDLNFLDVDGVRLEYRWAIPAWTRPDSPVLVLLHEGLGCVAAWKAWPDELAEASGCRVFVYSRAGYGASDPVSLPRPIRYMHHEGHAVLPRVLDVAGIDDAVLVGHSDGGSIAIIMAGGEQDSRVRGLVLLAAHVFNEQICVDAIRQAAVAYEQGGLREGLRKYHGDNVDVAFRGWNQAWLHPDFWHWNLEEYLPGIGVPALIMQGRQDQYGTAAQVEAIAGQVAGPTTVCWLDDCGHAPHREAPVQSIDAIKAFVNSLTEAGNGA